MHPKIGWSMPFSIITRLMAISVPVLIILQIISIILLFFSTNDASRFNAFETILKFGASYLLILSSFPFWTIFLACSIPGPKPEKFGEGHLRVKTSLVMLAAAMLTTGAIVRTYAFFNPRAPDNDDVLYSKPVFYTTQFTLEIMVVAAYAIFRFDLLFHIPNGSSKAGDYSKNMFGDTEKDQLITRESIETRIAAWGVPHQILAASYSKSTAQSRPDEPVYAVFFPETESLNKPTPEETEVEAKLPPRPARRVSRRETLIDYVQQRRPSAMEGTQPSYYDFAAEGDPNLPRRLSIPPSRNVAPQFIFTRPRKSPEPPR